MNKKEKLEQLNKEYFDDNLIIYDYLADDEGNINYLFSWAKELHISSLLNRIHPISTNDKISKFFNTGELNNAEFIYR